jgi:hypothetical protein
MTRYVSNSRLSDPDADENDDVLFDKYDLWQLKTIYNAIGIAPITTDDGELGDIQQDQLWAVSALDGVLKTHTKHVSSYSNV